MFRRILIAALVVSALTCFAAPGMSPGVLAQAGTQPEAPLNLSVTLTGDLQVNGWFTGPVTARAVTDNPQASLTHSLNGGPAIRGREITLTQPGRYAIAWKVCKGMECRQPFMQYIKIASVKSDGLHYSPALHKWSFGGTVVETRQVYLLGMPTQVAKVQSFDYYAWAVLNLDTENHQLGRIVMGSAEIDDRVVVSISGPFVTRTLVDWNQCQPRDASICQFGWLYDDGPMSGDWNVPLSPSNEFIHYGHPNPSWEQALFWNTEKVSRNDDNAPGFSKPHRDPGNPKPRWFGCLALRGGSATPCRRIAADDAARLPFLVESPVTWGARGLHTG